MSEDARRPGVAESSKLSEWRIQVSGLQIIDAQSLSRTETVSGDQNLYKMNAI